MLGEYAAVQRYKPTRGDGVDYESFMLMGESELLLTQTSATPSCTFLFAELTPFLRFTVHWDPHR